MFAYARMFSKLAAEGVCVVAPSSCPADEFCQNGEVSYLEVLRALNYVDKNQVAMLKKYPFDYS